MSSSLSFRAGRSSDKRGQSSQSFRFAQDDIDDFFCSTPPVPRDVIRDRTGKLPVLREERPRWSPALTAETISITTR
jgi:hypothetical protein